LTIPGFVTGRILVRKVGPRGVEIGFRDDFRIGAPPGIFTPLIGALWMWL
jgi:hypothetical protein